jgi:hypothetical protein
MTWDIGFTVKDVPVKTCRWKFINETDALTAGDWLFDLHEIKIVKTLPKLEKMISDFEANCKVHLKVRYDDFSETRLIASVDDNASAFLALWKNEILPKIRLIATVCPKSKVRWFVYEAFLE